MANSKKVAVKPVKSGVSKRNTSSIKELSIGSKKPSSVSKKVSRPGTKKILRPAKENSEAALSRAIESENPKPISSKLKSAIKKVVKPITSLLPDLSNHTRDIEMDVAPEPIEKKIQQESRTRYSDTELEEFKQLIVDKLEAARKELKYLQDQINRRGDNGTDDTENKFASSDDGSSSMEREYLNQMAARQIMYMDHLNKALVRIRNKTYGICRVTGKLIEKDRLKAVPHATLSMEAKRIQSHS
jgi:RNA polymerase-binding transcription factor DksA